MSVSSGNTFQIYISVTQYWDLFVDLFGKYNREVVAIVNRDDGRISPSGESPRHQTLSRD